MGGEPTNAKHAEQLREVVRRDKKEFFGLLPVGLVLVQSESSHRLVFLIEPTRTLTTAGVVSCRVLVGSIRKIR